MPATDQGYWLTLPGTRQIHRLGIFHLAGEVRVDGVVASQSDRIGAAVSRGVVASPRQTGPGNDGAGECPAAEKGVLLPILSNNLCK